MKIVSKMKVMFAALFACVFIAGVATAGTGGTEFNAAYATLTGWLGGDLGRLLAAGLLIVGLAMGIVRQSIVAAVPAIGAALVVQVAPTIISAIVTATI